MISGPSDWRGVDHCSGMDREVDDHATDIVMSNTEEPRILEFHLLAARRVADAFLPAVWYEPGFHFTG